MNRFLEITFVEWKLNLRNFLNIFFSLIFPVMMLLLFATMYGNEPSDLLGGYGFVDVSVSGYTCMVIAVSGLMTLPLTIAQYRERKILKRFMATPVKPSEILFSQLVVNGITTVAGIIILLAIGKVFYNLKFMGNLFEAVFVFLLIMVSIFSIGLLIAGVSKNTKAATAIAYIVYFPMLFLSGATMPLEIMPDSILTISKMLPLTYGVILFKGIWLGDHLSDYPIEIIVLAGIALVFGGISIRFFKWE